MLSPIGSTEKWFLERSICQSIGRTSLIWKSYNKIMRVKCQKDEYHVDVTDFL